MRKRTAIAAGTALAASGGVIAYLLFFRRWCLTWGARPGEASMKLPGDELLAGAGLVSTRAVMIDAPPAAVWPWLVQMGSGRGGAYTSGMRTFDAQHGTCGRFRAAACGTC